MRILVELGDQAARLWPWTIAVVAAVVYGRLVYAALHPIDGHRASLVDGGLRALRGARAAHRDRTTK